MPASLLGRFYDDHYGRPSWAQAAKLAFGTGTLDHELRAAAKHHNCGRADHEPVALLLHHARCLISSSIGRACGCRENDAMRRCALEPPRLPRAISKMPPECDPEAREVAEGIVNGEQMLVTNQQSAELPELPHWFFPRSICACSGGACGHLHSAAVCCSSGTAQSVRYLASLNRSRRGSES